LRIIKKTTATQDLCHRRPGWLSSEIANRDRYAHLILNPKPAIYNTRTWV
jgi:hypothetical protein